MFVVPVRRAVTFDYTPESFVLELKFHLFACLTLCPLLGKLFLCITFNLLCLEERLSVKGKNARSSPPLFLQQSCMPRRSFSAFLTAQHGSIIFAIIRLVFAGELFTLPPAASVAPCVPSVLAGVVTLRTTTVRVAASVLIHQYPGTRDTTIFNIDQTRF